MKSFRIIALGIVAGALTLSQAAAQVVLLEQAVNFRLKLTTMKAPAITEGSTISVNLKTYTGTVTTKDVLSTLGFGTSAKLIVRVVAYTNTMPATVSGAIIVSSGGSETDVTDMLRDLLPYENPLGVIFDEEENEDGESFGAPVISGSMRASLTSGVNASLSMLAYGQASANLVNLQAGPVRFGDLEINSSAMNKTKLTLKGGWASGLSITLSTTTTVVGGAWLGSSPVFDGSVPAVVEGSVTTTGKSKISTVALAQLIDLSDLLEDL